MWIPYVAEKPNSTIVKDEEYKEQCRITIYHPGEISPYEIVCGIYGLMFHTVFASTLDEANEKYDGMKVDLQNYLDHGETDEDFCSDFVDKW